MIYTFEYDGKSYDYDDDQLSLPEAIEIKRETGMVGVEFFDAARKADPEALAMLLVLAMRRGGVEDATMDSIYKDDPDGYVKLISNVEVRSSGGDTVVPNRAARRAAARKKTATKAEAGAAEGAGGA